MTLCIAVVALGLLTAAASACIRRSRQADIGRKAAESRSARLVQLYAALSQCNQGITHAISVEDLLPTICRVVVESGGMKMAWVGMVDEATGELRSVASFGVGTEYLEGIQISANAEDPAGRGPTGTAIRENRPVWIQDFQHDPSTAPWHERGVRYGWAAAASLPLHRAGDLLGAITIYSDKMGFFDEEERRLLEEMAFDISFALDAYAREEERKQMEEALKKKTAEMERFTYAVSHDLKSPLATIKIFLGFLEKDLKAQNAEQVAKDLSYIHGAADKMGEMLGELLTLARVGYNRYEVEQVALQEIVREAMNLVAGQLAERGVQVEVTEEPVWITGERARLVEVFQNLLDNAVKFLGDEPAPKVQIGIENADGELAIFVRDNGKGIAPSDQEKVFGVFEKLNAAAPGSGLGLALVRRIVDLHGGKIWLESKGEGHGSTFRFSLAKIELRPHS